MPSTGPKYDLKKIKKLLCSSASYYITQEAYKNAVQMGYIDEEAIIDVIENMQEEDFYKSMTSDKIPGLWQDVYRVKDMSNIIYIKLQISSDARKAVIIQFKEK